MPNDFQNVAIAAGTEVPYRRRPPEGTTGDVLAHAFQTALEQSGFDHHEVDGFGVASFTLRPDNAIDMAWRLGISPRWIMDDSNGGASAINMLQHAARAIQCGDASVIVLVSGDRFDKADFKTLVENYNLVTRTYLRPLKNGGPNALFAMLTQRHAQKFKLSRSDYGRISIAQRAWATLNPGAVYRSILSLDDYLNAPMVADPLCLFDCVPVVTGANAIVLARPDRIPSKHASVAIRAIAPSYNADNQLGDGLQTALATLSPRMWHEAEASPAEMDVISVYDDYPVMALIQLADLGFAEDGGIGRLIERVEERDLSVNTSGGQLSAGQAGAAAGMHGLVEAITQLRHQAGERQIEGARLAVVSGYGMVNYRYGMCASAVVLEGNAGR